MELALSQIRLLLSFESKPNFLPRTSTDSIREQNLIQMGDTQIQVNIEDNNGDAAAGAFAIPKNDTTREQESNIPIEFHAVYFAFNSLLIQFIQFKSSGEDKIPNMVHGKGKPNGQRN